MVPGSRKNSKNNWVIVVHGGAGKYYILQRKPELKSAFLQGIKKALLAGAKVLQGGGKAVDAVINSVSVLEENPLFNAGKGAVLNRTGEVELDACVMDGSTRATGAVAALKGFLHPIQIAYKVMTSSNHVLLCGEGAKKFAIEHGFKPIDENTLKVDFRVTEHLESTSPEEFGTVGAVAIDIHGNLAAATSTGGLLNKHPGRIGDSAIAGAGTYAENGACAVSTTGIGEYFQRSLTAFRIATFVKSGLPLPIAMQIAIQDVTTLGGQGGIIAVDANGNWHWLFTTPLMARGVATSKGTFITALD